MGLMSDATKPEPASVPKLMKAAFIRALGGPDDIKYADRPVPPPGPHEILLRMEAVAVNHVDLLVRSGAYVTGIDFPFTVGRDVVGTVVRCGAQVTGFQRGERVWCNSLGHQNRQGSFSEYVLANDQRCYPLPIGVDAISAVSVLHGGATAFLGLVREAQVLPGELVVILGAGGAVGSIAVQLGLSMGCQILAVAGASDISGLTGLGAQRVFDYRDPGLAEKLFHEVGAGAKVVWNVSGTMPVNQQAQLLAVGGRIVHSAGIHGTQEIDTGYLYRRDISLLGFAISNASIEDLAAAATCLNGLFAGPGIATRVGKILPLSQSAHAHRMLETQTRHQLGGKIVLVPDCSVLHSR